MYTYFRLTLLASVGFVSISGLAVDALSQTKLRARDIGVPFDGTPGPLNAITDVAGVRVGQVTRAVGVGAPGRQHGRSNENKEGRGFHGQ